MYLEILLQIYMKIWLQNKKPAECKRRQTFSCIVLMK